MNAQNLITTVDQNLNAENVVKNYYKVSYCVIGIKRKCRKVENHYFPFGKCELDDNKEEIIKRIFDHVDTNMKTVTSKVRISFDFIESVDQGGWHSEQWMPFSDKNITYVLNMPVREKV